MPVKTNSKQPFLICKPSFTEAGLQESGTGVAALISGKTGVQSIKKNRARVKQDEFLFFVI